MAHKTSRSRRRVSAPGGSPNSTPHSLREKDAGPYIGFSAAFLKADRARPRNQRKGPAYIQVGRSVRYRVDDLDRWLAAHRVEPRGPEAAA